MAKKRKNAAAAALGRKGGRARMKQLTKEQRQALARHAVQTRWAARKAAG